MPSPNLLVIGAARSGTTALTRFLGQHPDVFVSNPKEPHHLAFPGASLKFTGPGDDEMINRVSVTDEAGYHRLFASAGGATILAEGSVSTQYYAEQAIPTIVRACAPGVRFISVLRDPIERAHSAFLYLRSRGHEPNTDFVAALEAEDDRVAAGWHHMWHYRRVGLYAAQLLPFIETFGRNAVCVITHEELGREPTVTMSRLFDFLGLESIPIDTGTEINRSGEPRNAVIHGLMKGLRAFEPMRRAAKLMTTPGLRERVRSANLDHPTMPPEAISLLESFFAADMEDLVRLTGLDVSAWPTWRKTLGWQ
jgi:hypothetical protein